MSCVVIVFAFLLSLAMAETDLTSNTTQVVEFRNRNQVKKLNINFEAYTPKGLRVTVHSVQGIDLFSFQAKVNLPLFKRENGTLVWEVIHPLADKLSKDFPNEQLLIGDIVNFWVRIQMNGVSLQSESLSHIIRELISNKKMDTELLQQTFSPTYTPPIVYPRPVASNNNANRPVAVVMAENYCAVNEATIKDVWSQLNMTVAKMRTLEETIIPLEEKLNSLTETVVELLKNQNIGTNLMLVGNLPLKTNPVEDVRHLIVDKLKLSDLSTTILQAEYNDAGISFEVSSSIDKLRILKRSKDILAKLSFQIIDPSVLEIQPRVFN